MTRIKLASVGFVAARNSLRQQVLDDAKSLPICGRSQSATTCDSSYAPNSAQYYSSTSQYCSVLLCTTKCYSSTTLYYKVLLQYYTGLLQYCSVLQSTTPCHKVLCCSVLQSASPVLHRTIPVLLHTTKCYSSTTLYYKVLLCTTKYFSSTMKYYSSTTLYYKVLLRTEKSYMKFHWHCEEQPASLSNLTKYCACHEKWMRHRIARPNNPAASHGD